MHKAAALTFLFLVATFGPAVAQVLDWTPAPSNPRYPARAALNCVEGEVTLEFHVSRSGRPWGVDVVEATPPGMFEYAAYASISTWQFEPPLYPYQRFTQTIEFRMQDGLCDNRRRRSPVRTDPPSACTRSFCPD
ncbi:MAG TPA: energy transducer TonB [Xanthomonadaceae bacterium]|nr:energy transducer TonB [Xanthomonadaceae bacterium]